MKRKIYQGGPVYIKNLTGLHRLIAKTLINCRSALTGKEMIFLRRELRLLQQELAERLGVDPVFIHRWENSPRPLPRHADIALRALYAGALLERSEKELFVHLISESAPLLVKERLYFIFSQRHWQRYQPAPSRA
ncbi:helix-turn-helix domain-containing protein [Martelella alba]|uniref:Transcriptional regulator n=1 Tax=Martelella alba TaxID=2590451 RepID=A0ABY2SJ72_9HYPH|nr:helix-turn-helix domain-containing protein [Martelella alba]TKI05336.1 transcriptional regulator [Martelella alba]